MRLDPFLSHCSRFWSSYAPYQRIPTKDNAPARDSCVHITTAVQDVRKCRGDCCDAVA